MLINRMMQPYLDAAKGWESLQLPTELEAYINDEISKLTPEAEVEHIHVRDFGIRDHYLGYGLCFVRRLFEQYRAIADSRSLIAYVSLDDGGQLAPDNIDEDGQPWFDCAVHFHVRRIVGLQWAESATIEKFIQPVLIVESKESGQFSATHQ